MNQQHWHNVDLHVEYISTSFKKEKKYLGCNEAFTIEVNYQSINVQQQQKSFAASEITYCLSWYIW